MTTVQAMMVGSDTGLGTHDPCVHLYRAGHAKHARRRLAYAGSSSAAFSRSIDPRPFLSPGALMLEQPALALQPAAVLHQRTVGADQAVAGQDGR